MSGEPDDPAAERRLWVGSADRCMALAGGRFIAIVSADRFWRGATMSHVQPGAQTFEMMGVVNMSKLQVSAEAGSLAAMMMSVSLIQRLTEKGVLSTSESNEIMARAASMCRANGIELAAATIENICPTCVGIDVVAAAEKRGATIVRVGESPISEPPIPAST